MSTQQEVEPQMESLLLRTVPGLAEQWRGATPATIEKIERILPAAPCLRSIAGSCAAWARAWGL